MRDQHDANTLRAQSPAQHIERLGLGVRQGRRRLVHDQHCRVGDQCLGNLHQLSLAHAQTTHRCLRVGGEAERAQHGGGPGPHARAVGQAPARQQFLAEEDVFDSAERVDEIQLLMDRGNTCGLRGGHPKDLARLAAQDQLTPVGLINAGQDFHQRRLARTVFTGDGMDLARLEIEVDACQRLGAAERHTDAGHANEAGPGGCHCQRGFGHARISARR